MDKLKRFLDCYIPTHTCNLRCHYCYVSQRNLFDSKIERINHSPEEIVRALSKERLGGTCLINFCAGGETLLSEEVLDIAKALLREGHYLMIVTNGTLKKRFQEIANWESDLLKHLFFKFSFHYLELKRLNQIELFFENVNLMKDAGCSFTVEITPTDELIPHIEDVKSVCLKNVGALPQVTIARDERVKEFSVLSDLSWEEYKKIWEQFDSQMFSFKYSVFGQKRKEFCYAGDWSAAIDLHTGKMRKCTYEPEIDNIYRDLDAPLNFSAIGKQCSMEHCYNSHAWLTLGTIPQLNAPTFAQVRDRKDINGNHWLTAEFDGFISQKLKDSNSKYSIIKKMSLIDYKAKIGTIPGVYKVYELLKNVVK